jgi:dynactin complex subunit
VKNVLLKITLVLHIMTVNAKKLPVTSVRRIVFVIVVLVMDRKLTEFLPGKFSSASTANPGEHIKSFLPVGSLSKILAAPSFRNNLI